MERTVKFEELPTCNLCSITGRKSKATVNTKTSVNGKWMYLCDYHDDLVGVGVPTKLVAI